VINFYVDTSREETIFFEGEIVKDDSVVIDNDDPLYFVVDLKYLRRAESFSAEPGSVWLLDTTVPHQVLPTAHTEKFRELVQIYFMDATFDEVSAAFEKWKRYELVELDNLEGVQREVLSTFPPSLGPEVYFQQVSLHGMPSLLKSLEKLGIAQDIIDYAFVITYDERSHHYIHRDAFNCRSISQIALNIPISGCENTRLAFYKRERGAPQILHQDVAGGVSEPFIVYSPNDVVEVDGISYSDAAVLWRITNIHDVVGTVGKRITLSIRFKDDSLISHLTSAL